MKNSVIVATLAACAAFSFGCHERLTSPREHGDLSSQQAKGGKQASPKTVTFTFRDAGDRIFGDGRVQNDAGGTVYTNDKCGVVAVLPNLSGNPALRTKGNPIKQNEVADCGNEGREGRVFNVSFEDNRVDSGDPLEWDQQTMTARAMDVYYELRTIQKGQTEDRKLSIAFDDQGGHGGGGFGLACPWFLRFDSEYLPQHGIEDPWGTSDVQVTRLKQQSEGDEYDEWKIEASPEDVAVCLGGKSEPIVLGYYHVPFQMNVVCEGEC